MCSSDLEVTVSRSAARAVVGLAGATYFMYLMHAIVLHFAVFESGPLFQPPALTVFVCVVSAIAGLVYARVWSKFMLWSRTAL